MQKAGGGTEGSLPSFFMEDKGKGKTSGKGKNYAGWIFLIQSTSLYLIGCFIWHQWRLLKSVKVFTVYSQWRLWVKTLGLSPLWCHQWLDLMFLDIFSNWGNSVSTSMIILKRSLTLAACSPKASKSMLISSISNYTFKLYKPFWELWF